MKEYLMKHMETFVYGILSLMFSAAFFFGVLYPSRGISPETYEIVQPPRSHRQETMPRCVTDKEAGQATDQRLRHVLRRKKAPASDIPEEQDVIRVMEEYSPDEIEYTFFLYECLKNS
ncbi:MAG: hypothetical protein IJ429_03470 [Lachnospiraceae bacterium]|nr:hypothetical protein [Lachnospiraceae bacterium]